MTFRPVLARQDAEALAARAIREEENLPALVEEILGAAVAKTQGGLELRPALERAAPGRNRRPRDPPDPL